jgi:hypothetical protein
MVDGGWLPTPAWLSEVLRQAGILRQGAVTQIEQQTSAAFNSQVAFLRLYYSADAEPDLPARVVWKRNIAEDWAREAGAEEVKFYRLVAGLPDHPPITPPCYAADYDEASGDSYLLLHDLSITHEPPLPWDQRDKLVDNTPTPENSWRVVDMLARFHAYWWQHPLLTGAHFTVGYWTRNAERFALYLERRQRSWDDLVTAEGARLPVEIRELYEWVMPRLHYHWEHYLAPRFRDPQHLTVVHGDSYFSNFLCPRPGQVGNTYLLDWQSPTVDLASYDLVNLIAPFWTRAQRQHEDREQQLLRRYYTTLCAHGVIGYTWEDLLTDYRSGLIFWLLMPVQDRFGGASREYWWPKLQCLVAAFQDWECADLLRL